MVRHTLNMQLIRLTNQAEFVKSAITLINKIVKETDGICQIALVYSDKDKYELPAKGILVDSNSDHDTMIYILFIV